MDVHEFLSHYSLISKIYPENSKRTNYFYAACKTIDPTVFILDVREKCQYGGMIGIGNSPILDCILERFKIMRLHAIFHDAAGFMKSEYNKGPGYCYSFKNFPINCCLLGHVTGIAYC